MFDICSMGIETPHDNTFKIIRPLGMGVCVFLLTMEPCVVSVSSNQYYESSYPPPKKITPPVTVLTLIVMNTICVICSLANVYYTRTPSHAF